MCVYSKRGFYSKESGKESERKEEVLSNPKALTSARGGRSEGKGRDGKGGYV